MFSVIAGGGEGPHREAQNLFVLNSQTPARELPAGVWLMGLDNKSYKQSYGV